MIFQNTNIQNTEYKPLNIHFHWNTITHCKLYRRDSCTNSEKVLSYMRSRIKEKKNNNPKQGENIQGVCE